MLNRSQVAHRSLNQVILHEQQPNNFSSIPKNKSSPTWKIISHLQKEMHKKETRKTQNMRQASLSNKKKNSRHPHLIDVSHVYL